MIPMRAHEVVRWTGGRLVRGSAETSFGAVSTDTRGDLSGRLFVALIGAKHDAHAFLGQALAGGAAGVLVQRPEQVRKSLVKSSSRIAI